MRFFNNMSRYARYRPPLVRLRVDKDLSVDLPSEAGVSASHHDDGVLQTLVRESECKLGY
jgi:hypothetical protein